MANVVSQESNPRRIADCYLGSDGSQHVNFFAAGTDYNHVQELYVAPGSGWVNNDLTSLADGFVPNAGRARSAIGAATTASMSTTSAPTTTCTSSTSTLAPPAGWTTT
jgi:hypothetical protein